MIKVLIVEDAPALNNGLATALTTYGLSVQLAKSADSMRASLREGGIDVVLLDHTLPDGYGVYLCREIRLTSDVPVILLSSVNDKLTEILGLELGADDYILKPVGPRELLARIRALLRRARFSATPQLAEGHSTPDPKSKSPPSGIEWPLKNDSSSTWLVDWRRRQLVDPDRKALPLSGSESRMLAAFLHRPGIVLTRAQLVEMTNMQSQKTSHRVVDLVVSRLRAKLKEPPNGTRFIRTVRGVGYRFKEGSIVELPVLDRA